MMILLAACSSAPSEADASAEERAAESSALLPDIVSAPPANLAAEPDEEENLFLAFGTRFDNPGDGPLIVEAEATEAETMAARRSVMLGGARSILERADWPTSGAG